MPEPAKLPKPILKKPPARVSWSEAPIPATVNHTIKSPAPAPAPAIQRLTSPLSFHPQPKRRNHCRLIRCFLDTALLLLLAAVAVAGGLFYLWFAPKPPIFKLAAVSFNRFAVITEPDNSSFVRTGLSVWLEVKNPSERLVVYYGGSHVRVFADVDTELGSASFPGFTQASWNVTVLRAVIGTGSEDVAVDLETGKRLKAAVKSGAVNVYVEVKTKIGFGFGKFGVGLMVPADVACGGIRLKKLKDGRPLTCRVKWFGW